MMLRTPPPKRQRAVDDLNPIIETPPSVHHEDHHLSSTATVQLHEPSDQFLCTYQCRQMVKAEFLDALTTAEKQVCDYKSKLEELNDNFHKSEADRNKFRDQFLYIEQELAAAKGREQMLQEQLLKEVNDNQERFTKQLRSYSKLEVKFQNEKTLRQKAESSAAVAEEKAGELEVKISNITASIDKERKRLNNELVQVQRESKLTVSRIRAELEKMESRYTNAEKESELLNDQLEDVRSQLNECLQQKCELENKLSTVTFQQATSTDSSPLVKHLQEELRNYESEVREARKLKSSHENVELLKEKLLTEKSRRERAESELSKFQEFQLNMQKLEDELSSWKLLVKDIPDVSCPNDIPLKFASLQKEGIDSMLKVGEISASLKQMEVALDSAQLGKQNAETEVALSKEKAAASKSELKQLEMKLAMVTEERDTLKKAVNELKNPGTDKLQNEPGSGTIVELESSLEKKEGYIKELESKLREQNEVNSRQHDQIQLLNERLNNEARRIKSLERESDRLRSEISLLESKLGHGDYSTANTKVLRMVNTLGVDSEAKQTIEALRTELQKTKEKLQAIEELNNQGQSGDAGKLVDSYISGKITQLKEQIATLEKREERYKTVFADRISVFRRACCDLFGYKIVMDERQRPNGIPVTRFTLQSIYAQSEDEKLEFDYESGNTNILDNNYTSQRDISQQVDIFVRKMNSIPAFTANLTVESFNRRTMT
ncbi:hypothetical protein ACFE04_023403 [Oxalis oulophora]